MGRSEFFELEEFGPDALDRWKREFFRFLKSVTLVHDKRLVLKSPLHTFRIRFLLENIADARFVHIVRNPYETFSSTIHNGRSLYLTQGLQFPNYRHLKRYVIETFERMHERLSETRNLPHHSERIPDSMELIRSEHVESSCDDEQQTISGSRRSF